jgi:outer membrane protein TolC
MKKTIILSLLLTTLNATMSIDKAWQNVSVQNSGLKSVEDDVKRAKLQVDSGKSMYLPSVDIIGSYTHLSEPVKVDTSDVSAILGSLHIPFPTTIDLTKQDVFLADLHLLWPLYTGGKIDAAQDIYAAKLSEDRAKQEMKRDTEFLKLVKYYYGVVVSQSLLATRQEAEKALQIHYENAQKLKDQGQIANVELLNAEVKLDAAKIETTKAKHKFEIAFSALETITHSNATPSSKLFVNATIEDEEYYKKETRDNYAGLKILDAKESQSKALISMKEAAWYPEVMAYGNVNLYKDSSPLMETLPKWFAGVMVKIDLLQRKDRSQEIQIAELTSAKVKHLRAQAVEDLGLLVKKTYKEMLSDYEEFNALNSSVSLAKENYRLRSISFKEGLSTSVELVDAEMFLLGAKTKRLNAAYNYVQRVSQLCVLSGDREKFFEIQMHSEEIK